MKLKATTRLGWVVRGCLGLFLFSCIGLSALTAIGAMFNAGRMTSSAQVDGVFDKISASMATSEAEQAVATLPTAAPKPTDKPAPAAVPEPTAAPEPPVSATLANGLTPEENTAILAMGTEISTIGTSLGTLSTLMGKYDGTDSWKISMITPLVEIQNAHAALRDMDVPVKLQPFHNAILDATQDCNDSMDQLIKGIDGSNIASINKAATLMGTCSTKLTDAQPELQKLIAGT